MQKGASLEDDIHRSLRVDRVWKLDDDEAKTNGPRQYFWWNPLGLTFPANPIHPTDLPGIDDIPKPRFKPTTDEWEALFEDDKTTWSTISPHESNFPHPLTIMRDIDPEPSFIDGQSDDSSIKVFFLRGAGLDTLVVRNLYVYEQEQFGLKHWEMDKPQYALIGKAEDLKALEKHLSRVELRRWHPDQLNKRTGGPGEVDEGIGQKEENRAVFLALMDLVDMLRNPTKHFKHPADLDSRWEEHKKEMKF